MIRFPILIFLILVIFCTNNIIHAQNVITETLSVDVIEGEGFGCSWNLYAWSMASFKGQVYVGTNNLRGRIAVQVFTKSIPLGPLTNGAQVYRGSREIDGSYTWENVLSRGLTTRANFGVRSMAVVGDYLYGVTVNHSSGFEVLQTFNGRDWESVSKPGFGSSRNTSGRGLIAFKGHIYVGTENRLSGGQIWRHAVEDDGNLSPTEDWEEIHDAVFFDQNTMFTEFAVHNDGTDDYLYAGTMNRRSGAELWRTLDGETWEVIFEKGNGVEQDWAIMKMRSFNGLLYVGTMNFEEGASLLVSTDSSATEFDFIFMNGNGNKSNHYIWAMMEYEGRLYMSTFKNCADLEILSQIYSFLDTSGGAFCEDSDKGFEIYSLNGPSSDDLTIETQNAFGVSLGLYGIRSMVVHDNRLILGSAGIQKSAVVFEAESLFMSNSTNETSSLIFESN